jgi:hypothetical protein
MIRTIMAAALALACSLPAVPAQAAQRERVFVASYGSDSNPCTFGSPCKTFQQAVDVVATSGEVTAIDSAGFGPIYITRGVTITSPNGVEAGVVAAAGGTAITISATSADAVVLRGLTLEGANSANFGVNVASAAKLEIVDCVIRDFSGVGIVISATTNMLVHISNTKVMNNASNGLLISASASMVTADLSNITVIDNNFWGIMISGGALVTIDKSDISNNGVGQPADQGCNIKIQGSGADSQAYLKNVTMNGPGENCSIQQDGFSIVYISQVMGGFANQSGSGNVMYSDDTNIIQGPSVTFFPMPKN